MPGPSRCSGRLSSRRLPIASAPTPGASSVTAGSARRKTPKVLRAAQQTALLVGKAVGAGRTGGVRAAGARAFSAEAVVLGGSGADARAAAAAEELLLGEAQDVRAPVGTQSGLGERGDSETREDRRGPCDRGPGPDSLQHPPARNPFLSHHAPPGLSWYRKDSSSPVVGGSGSRGSFPTLLERGAWFKPDNPIPNGLRVLRLSRESRPWPRPPRGAGWRAARIRSGSNAPRTSYRRLVGWSPRRPRSEPTGTPDIWTFRSPSRDGLVAPAS